MNPPNTDTLSGFSIATLETGGTIESKTGLSISVSEPNALIITNISADNKMINTITNYLFTLECLNPIPKTANLYISFPRSEFDISSSSVSGFYGLNMSPNFVISDNQITITSSFESYLDANSTVGFEISSIQNPSTCAPSNYITASIETSLGGLICETTLGVNFEATAGKISDVSINPLNPLINENTIYSFEFRHDDSIPINGAIKITAPSQVIFANRSKRRCYFVQTGIGSNSLCEVKENKYLYITQCFRTKFESGIISFKLNDITNPSLAVNSDPFIIESYTSDSFLFLISQDSSSIITAFSASLYSANAIPDSKIVGDITNYTFNIQTRNDIPIGGIIKIVLPDEIFISDDSSACFNEIGLEIGYTCVLTSSTIIIENAFRNSFFTSGQISVTLSNIKNPMSTKPSSTLKFYTLYQETIIDSLTSGVLVTMETTHPMTGSLVPESTKVGDITNYLFSFQPFNILPKDISIIVTPPNS